MKFREIHTNKTGSSNYNSCDFSYANDIFFFFEEFSFIFVGMKDLLQLYK